MTSKASTKHLVRNTVAILLALTLALWQTPAFAWAEEGDSGETAPNEAQSQPVGRGASSADELIAVDQAGQDNSSVLLATSVVEDGITYNDAEDNNSRVNYSVIMGRGVEYGIVADTYYQANHTQTNFAVKTYDRNGQQVVEADLSGAGSVPFIVGTITDGNELRFGGSTSSGTKTRYDIITSDKYKDAYEADVARHVETGDDSMSLGPFHLDNFNRISLNPTFQPQETVESAMDTMIGHLQDESEILAAKPPTIVVSDDAIGDLNHFTIDTTRYAKDAVIYINVPVGSDLAKVLEKQDGINVRKYSDQTVVFNVMGENVDMKKFTVTVADQNDKRISSETASSNTDHNKDVDEEIVRKIVWNIPEAKNVSINTCAGLFLVPNDDAVVKVEGSSAGWIGTGGCVENRNAEWHFTFKGRKYSASDQIRFSGRKELYDVNTGALVDLGSRTFTFDLYESDGEVYNRDLAKLENDEAGTTAWNRNRKVEEAIADDNSKVSFGYLNITDADFDYNAGKDSQYYDEATGTWRRDFYYVVAEEEGDEPGVSYWTGELDIKVTAILSAGSVDSDGNPIPSISYIISSWKYSSSERLIDDRYRHNDNVNVVGDEFTFGALPNDLIDETSVTFTGVKTLENKTLEDKQFEFQLVEVINGAENVRQTVKNDGNGHFSFDAIHYTESDVGDHLYRVKEISTSGDGVTVDTKVYEVTITVIKGDDGRVSYKRTGDDPHALNFVNKYNASTDAEIEVGKKLVGGNLTEDQFSFTMTQVTDKAPMPEGFQTRIEGEGDDAVTVLYKTVTNAADGKVNFGTIGYTQDDSGKIYVYKIVEDPIDPSKNPDITQDTTSGPAEIYAKVVVGEDDGKGNMGDCTVGYYADEACETALESTQFVNKKSEQKTGEVTLSAQKALSGSDWPVGDDGKKIPLVFTLTGEGVSDTLSVTDVDAHDFKAITDLTPGTYEYVVTENGWDGWTSSDPQGVTFTVTVSEADEDGDGKLDVTVDPASKTATFTNTKQTVSNELEVTKAIDYWGNATSFDFELKSVDGAPMPEDAVDGAKVVTVHKDDASMTVGFGDIAYEAAGTYNYEIKEVVPSPALSYIVYDTNTHAAKVVVDEDETGALVIKSVTYDEGEEGLTISNSYKASGSLTLGGSKSIDCRSIQPDDTFAFEVKEGDAVVSTGKAEGGETIVYQPITYTYDGTQATADVLGEHVYTVTETAVSAAGVTKSQQTHTLKVKVSDNGNGTLNVETLEGDPQHLDFVNAYEAKGLLNFGGTKSIDKRTLNPDDVFEFEVKEGSKVVAAGTNDETGKISYGTITYVLNGEVDNTGEHTYVVSEKLYDARGVKSSETTHTVRVRVSDNGNGTLDVAVLEGDKDKLDFINMYSAAGSTIVKGVKSVDVGTRTDLSGFKFKLEGDGVKETAVSKADGTFEFSQLNYAVGENGVEANATKKFTYTLSEIDVPAGYTAPGPVTLTVTVTDNATGVLEVQSDMPEGGFKIQNAYAAKGSITFEGVKAMAGRSLSESDVYEFQIMENDKVIATAKNEASGKIAYPVIEYRYDATHDDLGTHVYTVKEVAADANGVVSDKSEYTVTVTVSDESTGNLKVEASDNAKALNFTNTYTASGNGEVKVKKTLSGRDWNTKDSFTFKIEPVDNAPKFKTDTVTITKKDSGDSYEKSFGEVTFTEPGTYKWTVTEENAGKTIDGVAYDKEPKTVTIEVVDDGKGNLVAAQDSALVQTASFKNTYTDSSKKTEKTTSTSKSATAKTGDSMPFGLVAGMALAAIAALVVLLVALRRVYGASNRR